MNAPHVNGVRKPRTLGALRSEIKEEDGAAVRGTFAEQGTQWPRLRRGAGAKHHESQT
jgi:hypothetical protein